MRRVPGRAVLAIAVVACLWPWSPPPARPSGPLVERLVGPFASLAASVEWVRSNAALDEGRFEHAYARAERALELDPGAPQGWIFFSHHLIFDRASALNERRADERRRWISSGIDLLRRGESASRDPGEVAFSRGLAWSWVAQIDEATGLQWPGGAEAALREAIAALEAADGHGRAGAAALAHALRHRIEGD